MEVRRTDKKEMISVEITLTKEQWTTLAALLYAAAPTWVSVDLCRNIRIAVWSEEKLDVIKAQPTAGTGQV